jgi:hypothetical protein
MISTERFSFEFNLIGFNNFNILKNKGEAGEDAGAPRKFHAAMGMGLRERVRGRTGCGRGNGSPKSGKPSLLQ